MTELDDLLNKWDRLPNPIARAAYIAQAMRDHGDKNWRRWDRLAAKLMKEADTE